MKTNMKTLPKDISNKIYREVKELLDNKNDFEEVLDNKLINELFSRRVALHVEQNKLIDIEPNEFVIVKCLVEDGVLDVSVGKIKKNVNGESKLTYGII